MEPDKCEEWQWMSWTDLIAEIKNPRLVRKTLFMPLLSLIEEHGGLSLLDTE